MTAQEKRAINKSIDSAIRSLQVASENNDDEQKRDAVKQLRAAEASIKDALRGLRGK